MKRSYKSINLKLLFFYSKIIDMEKVVFFLALSVFAILIGTLLLGGQDKIERLRYESYVIDDIERV